MSHQNDNPKLLKNFQEQALRRHELRSIPTSRCLPSGQRRGVLLRGFMGTQGLCIPAANWKRQWPSHSQPPLQVPGAANSRLGRSEHFPGRGSSAPKCVNTAWMSTPSCLSAELLVAWTTYTVVHGTSANIQCEFLTMFVYPDLCPALGSLSAFSVTNRKTELLQTVPLNKTGFH